MAIYIRKNILTFRSLSPDRKNITEKKTQTLTSNGIYTFVAVFLGFIFAEPSSKVQQISSHFSKQLWSLPSKRNGQTFNSALKYRRKIAMFKNNIN